MSDQNYVQLYGGLLARKTSEDPVEPSVSKPRRAKKRKSVSEDDTTGIGKRGRPRVDPKDQSAVERRRTQIRLAQRAYRERKETTISELEQHVAQLKEIINEMNQTFLDYNSKTINSGITGWDSTLRHGLREATQRFLQLAKKADSETSSDDKEQNGVPDQPFDHENRVHQSMELIQSPYFLSMEQTPINSSAPVGMLGYEVTYEPESLPETQGMNENTNNIENLNNIENISRIENTNNGDYVLEIEQDPQWNIDLHQNHAEIPSPSSLGRNFRPNPFTDIPLSSNYTYSFQETTFARRLLRSSYESAFRLLNDQSTPRSEIYRRLRFRFCHSNIDAIVTQLRSVLSRSNKDNLEDWEFPILHLGDAGFHFPRGPLDNGAPLPQNWGERRNVGPWKQGRALNGEAEAAGPDSFASFAQCEGTWYDPNDVEEYYKSKGLFLDGSSSIAELEVDAPTLLSLSRERTAMGSPTSNSTESFTEPQSPHDGLVDSTRNIFHPGTEHFVTSDSDDDLSNPFTSLRPGKEPLNFSFNASEQNGKTTGYFPLQQSQIYPSYTRTPRKRTIAIDVDNLLRTLNASSICIGRSPGYRKENVDFAFMRAVEEALY